MTSEFPSNALGAKSDTTAKSVAGETPDPDVKKEKATKVTKGEVIKRKTPLGKRVKDTFFGGEDGRGVVEYIAFEVMVPAVKDLLADTVNLGVERLIFGDSARGTSRRTGRRPSSSRSNHTSYGARYRRGGLTPDPRERRGQTISSRSRASHDFDEIILETRGEADEVLDRLSERVEMYQLATVADLYDLVGVTCTYTDDKWGWEDLSTSGIRRIRQGYLLDLPAPDPID